MAIPHKERSAVIRLAGSLRRGSRERRALLGALGKAAAMLTPKQAAEQGLFFEVTRSGPNVKVEAFLDGVMVGEVESQRVSGQPCLQGFSIVWVNSERRNLGPLLYELMLDLVYPHPLMPDRGMVSTDAMRIWTHYWKNRSDIEKLHLDDPHDTLTRDPEDNCWQVSSKEWAGDSWADSPLAKAYRRKRGGTPVLDECEKLGLIG